MTQLVTCPSCGSSNQETARFCRYCGMALQQRCAHCGRPNRPTSRFCQQCGGRLGMFLLQNRYRTLQLLGRGGMGSVFLAEDTLLFNRPCVVKQMLLQQLAPADRSEAERNFRREAQLLATLRHSGIPQIYEYFLESDRYYLVMEYIAGQSLEDRLGQLGRLPEVEALRYASQVCDVLVYLASQQPPVVHRDVKPANIILRGRPVEAVLVDFGVAKPKPTQSQDTSALGTVGYAPVEQVMGQAEPRSDVYALAATIYHVLTGDDPGGQPFVFPRLSSIPPAIRTILERALQRNIQQRLDAPEMKAALLRLVVPQISGGLRLLEANTYVDFDRKTETLVGVPTHRFRMSDPAFYIGVRLSNLDRTRDHQHKMFVQLFSPDDQLYRVRQRDKPVVFAVGQAEMVVGILGLRISGTNVVYQPGQWRAVIYVDEARLAELSIDIVR